MTCPHCGGELGGCPEPDTGEAIAEAIEHGDELRAETEAATQDEITERTRIEAAAAVEIAEANAGAAVEIAEANAGADVAIAEAQAEAAGELADAAEDLAEIAEDEPPAEAVDEVVDSEDEPVTEIEVPPQITEDHDRPAARRGARTTSAFHARRAAR